MGEALGQLFVQEYFPPAAKQRYSDLVENMRTAYKERIQKLTWMSDSTKKLALDKLSRMTKKVGYPDHWKDFSALSIDRGPWVLNMQRASAWWRHYQPRTNSANPSTAPNGICHPRPTTPIITPAITRSYSPPASSPSPVKKTKNSTMLSSMAMRQPRRSVTR